MIEFEPREWRSKCGRYDIDKYVFSETYYRATEHKNEFGLINSEPLSTFAAAIAWCEQRQTQHEESNEV